MTPHTPLSALDPHSPVRLFPDDEFRIVNADDASKQLAFDLSAISTGTTRTVTLPDASGTMALLERAQTFTALATFALGLTVAGAAFASRGIQDDATSKVLDVSNGGTQWVTVKGDTANGPRISVGGAANANLYLSAGAGTGSLYLYTNNVGTCGLRLDHVAGGNRFITVASSNGGNPSFGTNAGSIVFSTAGLAYSVAVTGSAGSPVISTTGNMLYLTSSNGNVRLSGSNSASAPSLEAVYAVGVTNWVQVTGSNGGNPTIATTGGNLSITPAVVGGASIAASTFLSCGTYASVYTSANLPAAGNNFCAVSFGVEGTSLSMGVGAPTHNPPDGSVYFNSTGGAGTTLYQRRAGAWVATTA